MRIKRELTIKDQLMDIYETTLNQQNAKGLKNYNQTIDECPVEDYDWNLMALEESVDTNQYLLKEINRLRLIIKLMEKGQLK